MNKIKKLCSDCKWRNQNGKNIPDTFSKCTNPKLVNKAEAAVSENNLDAYYHCTTNREFDCGLRGIYWEPTTEFIKANPEHKYKKELGLTKSMKIFTAGAIFLIYILGSAILIGVVIGSMNDFSGGITDESKSLITLLYQVPNIIIGLILGGATVKAYINTKEV